jgi:hypothetical protein
MSRSGRYPPISRHKPGLRASFGERLESPEYSTAELIELLRRMRRRRLPARRRNRDARARFIAGTQQQPVVVPQWLRRAPFSGRWRGDWPHECSAARRSGPHKRARAGGRPRDPSLSTGRDRRRGRRSEPPASRDACSAGRGSHGGRDVVLYSEPVARLAPVRVKSAAGARSLRRIRDRRVPRPPFIASRLALVERPRLAAEGERQRASGVRARRPGWARAGLSVRARRLGWARAGFWRPRLEAG